MRRGADAAARHLVRSKRRERTLGTLSGGFMFPTIGEFIYLIIGELPYVGSYMVPYFPPLRFDLPR